MNIRTLIVVYLQKYISRQLHAHTNACCRYPTSIFKCIVMCNSGKQNTFYYYIYTVNTGEKRLV